jgi:hypothetical protein
MIGQMPSEWSRVNGQNKGQTLWHAQDTLCLRGFKTTARLEDTRGDMKVMVSESEE